MDKNKRNKKQKIKAPHAVTPSIEQTVSSNECTGMMPIPPENLEQWEAYQQLFSTELPESEFWHKS